MRVRLHTLGCRLNEAEVEAWAQGLAAQGHRLCGPDESADLVLVNTCAVTAEALRKSGQLLRRSRREDPNAALVVSGCAVSLPGPPPSLVAAADLVVPNTDKDRLVAIAADRLGIEPGPMAVPGRTLGPAARPCSPGPASAPSSRCKMAAGTAAPTASSPWPGGMSAAVPSRIW